MAVVPRAAQAKIQEVPPAFRHRDLSSGRAIMCCLARNTSMKLIIKIKQPGHELAVSFYLHLRKQKYIKFKGTQRKTQKPVSTEDALLSYTLLP